MDILLPNHVLQFLADHISSVAQLEILLLLHTNPEQPWSAAEIASELRIETSGAQQQLDLLTTARLLREKSPGRFAYAPATAELQATVTALAQAYLVRRVTVIGLIFAKPPAPPPAPKFHAFSDAFNLRKDPPDAPPPR